MLVRKLFPSVSKVNDFDDIVRIDDNPSRVCVSLSRELRAHVRRLAPLYEAVQVADALKKSWANSSSVAYQIEGSAECSGAEYRIAAAVRALFEEVQK